MSYPRAKTLAVAPAVVRIVYKYNYVIWQFDKAILIMLHDAGMI